MFFFGTFRHSLDDKSRCTLPNCFRDDLGKVVYATKGLDNCLNFYPEETFKVLCEKNAKLNELDSAQRRYQRMFFQTSFKYEVDKSGRITLSKNHLQIAGINKDIVIVGNNDHIEIWDKDIFEKIDALQNEEFESNAQLIAQTYKE